MEKTTIEQREKTIESKLKQLDQSYNLDYYTPYGYNKLAVVNPLIYTLYEIQCQQFSIIC